MSNDSAAETDEDAVADGLQEGAFVRVDYTARTVEEDRLVDTTDPEVAEEEGIDEDHDFGPRTIVLGEGHVFETVEDDIVGSEVGDSGSVVVPAEEAFGEYDEEEVRTVSKDKIPEDDRYPGTQVQIDGQEGFVETIIGGRARVDFNHPLAGDDIEYDWEIVETVEDREEKAQGLIEMFLDLDLNIWFQTDTVEEEQLVEDDEDGAADAEGTTDADGTDADDADTDEDEADDADTDEDEADQDDADSEAEDGDDEGPTYETVEVEKASLYIEATPQLTMNQQWMMQKQQIGQQLIDQLGIDRIVIQETIEGGAGGLPGMMGGMGGADDADIEAALEDADIDAEELAEEIE